MLMCMKTCEVHVDVALHDATRVKGKAVVNHGDREPVVKLNQRASSHIWRLEQFEKAGTRFFSFLRLRVCIDQSQ